MTDPDILGPRFSGRISIAANGCWEWNGYRTRLNYGQAPAGKRGKHILAHRLAFMIAAGVHLIPQIHVLHKCDNPACVNPSHLFLGDQAANMRDMAAKGRHWNSRKRYCRNGHSLDDAYTSGQRGRRCRVCQKANTQKYLQRKRKES